MNKLVLAGVLWTTLSLLAAPSARAQEADDPLDAVAECRVILVVSLERRDSKNYSGMTGSTFWFRVHEVLRFEEEPGTAQDPIWRINFRSLSNRSRNLARNFLLEWSLLYSMRDAPARQADDALAERLAEGERLILAAPTTAWFGVTGVVVNHKWGSLQQYGDPLVVALEEGVLDDLRSRLDDPQRAPEWVAPPEPTPPSPDLEDHPAGCGVGGCGGGGRDNR
jgi:hypothetical protein